MAVAKKTTADKSKNSPTEKKPVVKVKDVKKDKADGIIQEDNQAKSEATEQTEVKTAKAGKRSAKAVKEAEAKEAKEERKTKAKEEKSETTLKQAQKPARSKLERKGKNYRKLAELIDKSKSYKLPEATDLAIKTNPAKFDASVELHVRLGVDPKQADQNIRATVVLPAGTGKEVRVAIADDALLAKLDKEVIDFDVLVASPDMMPKLGKYARLLGPKGLMPNPKSGTVSSDVKKAAAEAKAGRVEYRVDPNGIVHVNAGKVSFGADKLIKNLEAILSSLKANKPSSLKSVYVQSIYLTTSMGPSIKVESIE